jgi:hypothetical protein
MRTAVNAVLIHNVNELRCTLQCCLV